MIGEGEMDPSYWLPALAFWALPAAYVLVRGIPAPRPAQVLAWGDVYDLELTSANRPVVERYLRRTKRLRTIGALAGLLFSIAFTAATEGRESNSVWGNGLLMAAAGYVVGALVAEAALSRPQRTLPRAASLEPRTLGQYLPGYAIWAQRVIPVLAVGLVPVATALEEQPFSRPSGTVPFAAVAAGLVAVGLALEGIERMIVRRAQPVVARDLLLADEAIRASSVHAMAGAGNALLLLGLAYLLGTLVTATSITALSWTFGILSFVALGLALSSWIDLGHPTSWRIRRRTFQETRA
jgi:hypothetical protein